MAIGTGIFLLVVGAILVFAVGDTVEAVDLIMIGYICMGAGVLAILISLVVAAMGTNTKHTEVVEGGSQPRTEERRSQPRTTERHDEHREEQPVVERREERIVERREEQPPAQS